MPHDRINKRIDELAAMRAGWMSFYYGALARGDEGDPIDANVILALRSLFQRIPESLVSEEWPELLADEWEDGSVRVEWPGVTLRVMPKKSAPIGAELDWDTGPERLWFGEPGGLADFVLANAQDIIDALEV